MRTILKIFFLLFLFFVFSSSVLAADPVIPGITCGMAGADNGADQCCYNKPEGLPDIPGLGAFRLIPPLPLGGLDDLHSIPDRVDRVDENIEEFEENYANAQPCVYGIPDPADADPSVPGSCTCKLSEQTEPIPQIKEMCSNYLDKGDKELEACNNCATGGGFWSGLGCIPLNTQNFITNFLLTFGIGFAGFFALLCILYSVFNLQISRGEPERIQKARENLTSCIIGLLLIIFSVFILRLVGVEILQLPGLSF